MGVCSQWHTKCSRQTKIGQFQITLAVDEKVLRFQVTMQDTVAVAVPNSLHDLSHEFLDHGFSQTHIRTHCGAVWKGLSAPTFTDRKSFHVFFKIEVQEFENKVEFVAIGMHNVVKADDVGILHFFEQGNLTNGCTGDTFILCFETDLLQGDDTTGMDEFAGFVNDTVRSCEKRKETKEVSFT